MNAGEMTGGCSGGKDLTDRSLDVQHNRQTTCSHRTLVLAPDIRPKSPEATPVCRFTVAVPPCHDVLIPAPTKRDPRAVANNMAASRWWHQFSHAVNVH